MGRRKIEIKPIKDDRNRSVTFLKRKGGLFKKAHELSVLCQVDVAVIIFGQNKKLYQYSSGDIREVITRHSYYPKAHEHKTPADFADKGADDDDESEDVGGSEAIEEITPPIHATPGHPYPNHPQYQQIQHAQSPSPSPPMQQNMFQPQQRLSVSQGGSRPTSRVGMHVRRTSSNLVPQDHPHPQAQQPQQMQYGYAPQYSAYQHMPPTNAQIQMYQQQQQQQHQAQIQQQQQQHPGHYSNPVPLHGQLQQMYLEEEQRRQSLPPAFAMQIDGDDEEGAQAMHQMIPPQRPQRSWQSPPPASDPRAIHGHKRTAQNSFTPVDEDRSMMSQQWPEQHNLPAHGGEYLSVRHELGTRSQSIDVGSAMRIRDYGALQPTGFQPGGGPGMRTVSVSAIGGAGGGGMGSHMRNNSLQDLKRPRLTVQIPGEAPEPNPQARVSRSVAGSGTTESAESSALGSGSGSATAGPGGGGGGNRTGFVTGTRPRGASNSVVLPPPSPSIKSPSSAGGVLSAGATGPQNPFARPPPPLQNNNSMQSGSATQAFPYRENDTPLSALPSRFMSGELLPSPSQFYGDWGFGQGALASPAQYQPTPLTGQGPSWREEEDHKQRPSDSDNK